jgi:hypothetical protein
MIDNVRKGGNLAARILCLWLVIVTVVLPPVVADAKKQRSKLDSSSNRNPANDSESDGDEDAFDPFADFSEFESNRDEEDDINFFKNGRMLTLGFQGGMVTYTGEMGQKYQPSFRYGLFVSYFFDLHFATQLNWLVTDSPVSFRSPTTNMVGNSSLNSLGFSVKYFLNTQNVTKGLADLNPYFLLGMGSHTRTVRLSGTSGGLKHNAMGFNGGMGIELPMLRKKLFWGLQLNYDLVNFKDENEPFSYNSVDYGTSKGDFWNLIGSIGLNF